MSFSLIFSLTMHEINISLRLINLTNFLWRCKECILINFQALNVVDLRRFEAVNNAICVMFSESFFETIFRNKSEIYLWKLRSINLSNVNDNILRFRAAEDVEEKACFLIISLIMKWVFLLLFLIDLLIDLNNEINDFLIWNIW